MMHVNEFAYHWLPKKLHPDLEMIWCVEKSEGGYRLWDYQLSNKQLSKSMCLSIPVYFAKVAVLNVVVRTGCWDIKSSKKKKEMM